MLSLDFERNPTGRVSLDFCFACQVIWFDTLESGQLTPRGVLEVFTAMHVRRDPGRNPLPALLSCPRCQARLALTHDLQHTTHFTYFRCPFGHGRLTPFFQFLLEKNFVRPITGAELAALKAKVQTIQCSNCGAPLDLMHDAACKYCGSPISILDPEAVTKAVRELGAAHQRAPTVDFDRLAEALTIRPPPASTDGRPIVWDLVGAGMVRLAGVLTRF
jgi:DNA-directed RNA polymerase subunit RPC12/RpoP